MDTILRPGGARVTNVTLRLRRYAIAIAIAVCTAVAALIATAPSELSALQIIGAGGLILLGVVPSIVALWRAEVDAIPLLPLHGLFYSITFGLPAFTGTFMFSQVDDAALTEALFLTCAGLLTLYIGYYVVGAAFRKLRPIQVKDVFDEGWFVSLGALFVFSKVLVALLPGFEPDSTVTQLTTLLAQLGVCLLSALIAKPDRHFLWRIVAFAGVGEYLLVELLSGALARLFIVILFVALVFWRHRHKIPVTTIVVLVLLFIALNPIKGEFRRATWGDTNLGITEKASLFWDVLAEHNPLDLSGQTEHNEVNIDRIGHALTFARIIQATPSMVPYWRGQTLMPLLTKPIPRILWPDKPEERLGNEFWQSYGILPEGDFTTSYNLPWLPELYANFGSSGVIFGAMIIGVLFRFLVEKFRVPDGNDFRFYFGLVLFIGLFWAESNISLMLGGLVLNFVALLIVFRLMAMIATRRFAFVAESR